MRQNTTIRGQVLALTLIPVILLVIGFVIAMRLWAQTLEASAQTQHQTAVLIASQTVLETVLDAETSARAFAATQQNAFLEPYRAAEAAAPRAEQRLLDVAAPDAAQIAAARRVTELATHEFDVLARYVALVNANRVRQARTEIAGVPANAAMSGLRRQIGDLQSMVRSDGAATLARTELTSLLTRNTFVTCIVFGLIFAAAASWHIAAAMGRRVDLLLEKARRLAEGEELRRPAGGSDEISDIDRAFQHLAALLEKRTGDLERYRLLADSTQDLMLFARARDGRIVHANAAALTTYGYPLEAICELRIGDLQAPGAPAGEASQPGSGDSFAYEADQLRSNGTVFPGEVTVESRQIGGEELQLRIVRDITERKRAEALVAEALGAARNAARAKSEFLATMSHEIRTPMNAVIGMTELVLAGQLSDEQREALQIVNDSGTALLRIIDDVLDFSKIEAGKLAVEIIEFPFAQTIESVAMTLAAQARTRGLELTVFADPRAPATLYGDAGRIRQVLTNLVGNAIKFTHAGSVSLCAEVTAATKDWCEIRFSVTDTGIGISREQLERIFAPFAQADASTTRLYGGSGLGLSICHQLVELMGGELRADSLLGRGSTFAFGLRLRAGESHVPIERRDLRALVVAPPADAAPEITRYLRAWGLDVSAVSSRAAVLAAFETASAQGRCFDLVIMDAELLGCDAFALSTALAADPRFAPARRILIAGHDLSGRGPEAVAAGFSAYLVHPLRQSQLFDCILNVAPVPASPRVIEADGSGSGSGLKILLAEDNMINQRVALQQLYRLGHDATVVGTGREALAAAIAEHYDVILMDCFMPEMDGYAATGAIRRHQSRTGEHTPIIAMTANAQNDDRDACIAAGMDDYLAKPVTLAAMRSVLDRFAHGRGTPQALRAP